MKFVKCMVMGLLLISGVASASEFDSSVSEKDAATIHRIAVVVSLGSTFRADFRRGVVGFGDRRFDVPVPQWDIDHLVAEHIVSMVNMGARFHADALIVDDLDWPKAQYVPDGTEISGVDKSKLLERAGQQGEDAILVVTPVYGVPATIALPGFGLLGDDVHGKRDVCVLAYIAVSAYRTSDGHTVGQQFSKPCATKTDKFEMKDAWSNYGPDEQSAVETAVKQGVTAQIDLLLGNLKVMGTGK
ncbi:MAG TPA: hypothetical protein VGM97_07825 [Steroidobacteraceae bacterium]|jgi:hypothetical protein